TPDSGRPTRLAADPGATGASPAPPPAATPTRKRSFKEQRELEQLPATIESLETRLAAMTAEMNDPGFFQRDSAAITTHNRELAQLQGELDKAYARWSELEG
ncbi:ABC transporter ATP-binding protein, partial [Lysobacter zhanggongensis]